MHSMLFAPKKCSHGPCSPPVSEDQGDELLRGWQKRPDRWLNQRYEDDSGGRGAYIMAYP